MTHGYVPPSARRGAFPGRVVFAGGGRRVAGRLRGSLYALRELTEAVRECRERTAPCSVCHTLTEADPCSFCTDERRDAIAYLETKSWGHGAPYLRAYEILSTDPHPMVRAQAMRALGTSHQAAEGTFLVKGLNDANVQVRRDAACGLVTTWTHGKAHAGFARVTRTIR